MTILAVYDFTTSRALSDVHEINPETGKTICGQDYWNIRNGKWYRSDNPNHVIEAGRIGYEFSKVTCINCIRKKKEQAQNVNG